MSVNIIKPFRAGMWTTDLFDCCDDPTSFCESLWCPWCQVAAQHNRLTRNAIGVDQMCCLTLCLLDSCCTFGFATICTSIKYRGEIQRRYGIQQDDCANFCLTCWCAPCAISQQYREMCYRGAYPGGLCVSPPIGVPMGGAPVAPVLVLGTQQTVLMTNNNGGMMNNGGYANPNQPPPPLYANYPQQPMYNNLPQAQPYYGNAPPPPQEVRPPFVQNTAQYGYGGPAPGCVAEY